MVSNIIYFGKIEKYGIIIAKLVMGKIHKEKG